MDESLRRICVLGVLILSAIFVNIEQIESLHLLDIYLKRTILFNTYRLQPCVGK